MVNILPYHNIARKIYFKLGKQYNESSMAKPDVVSQNKILDIFKSHGVKATIGE